MVLLSSNLDSTDLIDKELQAEQKYIIFFLLFLFESPFLLMPGALNKTEFSMLQEHLRPKCISSKKVD